LYRTNYLKIPEVFSLSILILSFLFLFAGFLGNALSWERILRKSDVHVGFKACLSGIGLSIFGKYMPGKIWTIVGRAAYVAERNRESLGRLSAISLNAQFIALWVGMVLGAVGVFLLGGVRLWGWLITSLWLILSLLIFSDSAQRRGERLFERVFRKKLELPKLNFRSTLSLMPWFVLQWAFWSFGFYLLARSLHPASIPWSAGLGFPLAGSLGIMAVITPGGLGTREAVMAGYLALANFSLAEATTIAVASRLWFLVGEVFIFLVGWTAHKIREP
ncbi:MAG: lysylphosphatidylglycerol synthase transmembrane domain-containing protein, partial [Desulfobacterales bacterium]